MTRSQEVNSKRNKEGLFKLIVELINQKTQTNQTKAEMIYKFKS